MLLSSLRRASLSHTLKTPGVGHLNNSVNEQNNETA